MPHIIYGPCISDKTVATYRERVADKLGLKTRAALMRWAVENLEQGEENLKA